VKNSNGKSALLELVDGAIDYAGVFPPAELPIERAFRNYLGYRRNPGAQLLGRFVCTLPHLPAITELLKRSDEKKVYLTLITPTLEAPEVMSRNAPLRVTALETKVEPASFLSLEQRIRSFSDRKVDVLVEPLCSAAPTLEILTPMLDMISRIGADLTRGSRIGLKLRLGVPSDLHVPKLSDLAAILLACAVRGIPLKLTQGLQHPFTAASPGGGYRHFGLINVLCAALIASSSRRRSQTQLLELLQGDISKLVKFGPTTLTYGSEEFSVVQIKKARTRLLVSVGSFDFEEPRSELQELGYL
jgi:hypothetical protein